MTSGLFISQPRLILLITLYDALIYDTIRIILYKYTNKLIKIRANSMN